MVRKGEATNCGRCNKLHLIRPVGYVDPELDAKEFRDVKPEMVHLMSDCWVRISQTRSPGVCSFKDVEKAAIQRYPAGDQLA